MSSKLLRLAGAALVFLAVLEASGLGHLLGLPLGGSHVVQMAIILGVAFVACEVFDVVVGRK